MKSKITFKISSLLVVRVLGSGETSSSAWTRISGLCFTWIWSIWGWENVRDQLGDYIIVFQLGSDSLEYLVCYVQSLSVSSSLSCQLSAECKILTLIFWIRLSLYSLTTNNGPESVQSKARQTQRKEVENMRYIHHIMIWCDARGDSKLAKCLPGFTFNLVTSVWAPTQAWEHVFLIISQLGPKH